MTKFRMNNIKISDRVTSEVVLLNGWMDLDTPVVAQRRETARVLGLQGAPAESGMDPVRSRELSDFWLISTCLIGMGPCRTRSGHLTSQVHEPFRVVGQQPEHLDPSYHSVKQLQR